MNNYTKQKWSNTLIKGERLLDKKARFNQIYKYILNITYIFLQKTYFKKTY